MHPLFKIHFKHIWKCQKKIAQRCPSINLNIYVFTKSFCEKPIFLVSCIKKTNFSAKIRLFTSHFLSFLYRAQKLSGFHVMSLWSHTMWICIHQILFWIFFDISECGLIIPGAYAHRSQSGFHLKIVHYTPSVFIY